MYTILGLTLLMTTVFNQLYQTLIPDIPLDILNAIIQVETEGRAWEGDRIRIRFETNLFLDNCPEASNTFFVGNPSWTNHKMLTNNGWIEMHYTQDSEYEALRIAAEICPTAAYSAISIGSFQISAQHYKVIGFPFPSLMLSLMGESPERELEVFKRYLKLNPELYQAMVNEDLDRIAELYNPHNPFWKQNFIYQYNKLNQSK